MDDEAVVTAGESWIGPRTRSTLRSLHWPASIAFCAVFPVFMLFALFATAIQEDAVAIDFGVFYGAAESLLELDSPYVSANGVVDNSTYAYPPLTALGVAPFTVVSLDVAGLLAMAVLTLALLATLLVLNVRDWRCYGVALIWPPVIASIQTGSVTILLALGAALAWRARDRLVLNAWSAGLTVALKLILWPLLVWLVATRRVAAAALSVLVAAVLAVGSWAIIGFAGLRDYPQLLQRLRELVELDSYTIYVLALDAGASPSLARAVWFAVGFSLLVGVVLVGRQGGERTAFVLAVTAALALSPIVWLHYFTLLLVAVAVAQPRLGAAWFAPLAMYVATGNGNPTPFQTTATIVAASLTVALSVIAIRGVTLRSWGSPEPRLQHHRP